MKRLNGWYVVAFIALITALILALVGWKTDSVEVQLFYWGYLFYSSVGLWAGIGLLIFAVIMLSWWFIGGIFQGTARFKPPFGAGLVMLVAAVLLLAGSFPSLLVSLRHRDSNFAGEHYYHLAFRQIIDDENQFILYECDSLGLMCSARYISRSYSPEYADGAATGELQLSSDGAAINIIVNGETIRMHPVG